MERTTECYMWSVNIQTHSFRDPTDIFSTPETAAPLEKREYDKPFKKEEETVNEKK